MKHLIITFAIITTLSLSALGSNNMMSHEPSTSEISYSPQICQFSLSSYSGTIDYYGRTASFQVGLSCPQEVDVRATVVVFINNEHVASEVVTIKAGDDHSSSLSINVGKDFKGERYKLVVQ